MTDPISPDDPASWKLPQELVEFLRAGKQFEQSDTEGVEFVLTSHLPFEYDPSETEAGEVVLKGLDDLSIGEVRVDSFDTIFEFDDPHSSEGYYVLPAVSLVATRRGKPDDGGTLVWFPTYEQFGQWDRGHKNAIRFVCVTWTRIANDPGRFLDAKWLTDEVQAVAVTPWFDEHYDFRKGDAPF